MALELGPPSGTGKLIPLLLNTGTFRCTRSSCKQIGFSHTSPIARYVLQHRCDQWASAGAESVTKDLSRASRPQAILRFQPPCKFDYKACHRPQTQKPTTTNGKQSKFETNWNRNFNKYALLVCVIFIHQAFFLELDFTWLLNENKAFWKTSLLVKLLQHSKLRTYLLLSRLTNINTTRKLGKNTYPSKKRKARFSNYKIYELGYYSLMVFVG